MTRTSAVLLAAVLVCLSWAGIEARHLGTGERTSDIAPGPPPDPDQVERSFANLANGGAAPANGPTLLALRERAARGPYAGYAWFLLGEQAFRAGAHAAAVRHYRQAVETDPAVGDRGAAFGARDRILARLDELLTGPWRTDRPAEIRYLYYLKRRLAGGCE